MPYSTLSCKNVLASFALLAYFSLMNNVSPKRLTKTVIDGELPSEAERFVWDRDLPGFGLRITPKGIKSFIYQYRMRGEKNSRRYTIGRFGVFTAEQAREKCRALALMVANGQHPRDEAINRAKARQSDALRAKERAFASVADRWVLQYRYRKDGEELSGKTRTMAELVVNGFKDRFGTQSIADISKADLSAYLSDIPGIASRRNAYAYGRILWKWADDEELLDVNVFETLRAPPLPKSRDRVLSDDEFPVFWRATRRLTYPYGPLYRLLALTGQRESEVRGMAWEELSRDRREWIIPKDRTKNNAPQIVPLSNAMIAELDGIGGKKWPKRGFVFTVNGKKPVAGLSKAKARLDDFIAVELAKTDAEPIAPWRNHDLRRTLATGLQALGVRFEVTEAVLNHVSGSRGGVAGIYQQHDWKEEKREALDAWSAHVDELVKPKLATENAEKELSG